MAMNRLLKGSIGAPNGHIDAAGVDEVLGPDGSSSTTATATKKAPAKSRSGSKSGAIVIARPREEIVEVRIVGTRPLVVHNMDIKAVRQMASKWFKLPTLAKGAKDPDAEYESSKYVSPEGWEGMHAGAFRAAMVGAARQCDNSLTMTQVKRLLFVEPDGYSIPLEVPLDGGGSLTFEPKPLVRIIGESRMRTDMIIVDSGSPDVRFRAQYDPWETTLRIRFNANSISAAQVVNLVSLAGIHEGVGDIRPSAKKSETADLGTWEVADVG